MASLSPVLQQATPVQVAHGEGVHLYDTEGRRYLDFTAGIGVTSTGHCHPRVVAAAQEQVATLIHGQYTTVMHQPLLQPKLQKHLLHQQRSQQRAKKNAFRSRVSAKQFPTRW